MIHSRLFASGFALALAAMPVLAQDLTGDDLIISGEIDQNGFGTNDFSASLSLFDGRMCIGNACDDSTVGAPGQPPLKLRWSDPSLVFEDSTTTSSIPKRDWRIQINDNTVGGLDRFSIQDEGDTPGEEIPVIPFTIIGGAPENSFWIADDGDIGLGTSLPQGDLHIVSSGTPVSLRMQNGGASPYNWEMQSNSLNWFVKNVTGNRVPFVVRAGARDSTLVLSDDSFVGVGTAAPEELLHIRSDAANTDAFALFDANGSGSDAAFRLRQNGVIPTTWEFRNQQDSGRLNVGIAGGNTPLKIDNAAANNLLKLGRNGKPDEVVVTGKLLVNNTELNVPDYVFDDSYALRPLADVRSFIEANSHLPDVPSAADIAASGVDMTEMQMTLLKKVEELTLYTLALEDARAAQAQEIAELRRMITATQD